MSPVRGSGMPYLELAADCGRMTLVINRTCVFAET